MKKQRLMVEEQSSENPRVGGSIPPLGTTQSLAPQGFQPSGNLGRTGTMCVPATHENRHSEMLARIAAVKSASTRLKIDARHFAAAIPDNVPMPAIWGDEAEIAFEWFGEGDFHAIFSVMPEGAGYSYRNGRFIAGLSDADIDTFPADLADYLRRPIPTGGR